MAAGELRGVLTGNGASVGTSNNLTGSVVVSVNDLVFVCFGQQTNLTATGVTDNLGNTYTAQNAGTDPGNVTGRAFWARVTTRGTLTTVTVAAASSTNDYAGVAAVIAGPISTTNPDSNPANNNNTDNASPFTCPATGTLAQALEIVCSWMVGTGTSATWSATSPNLKAGQANNSTNVNVIVGYKAVSATTTTSPEFTGTNPTQSVQGTQSFRIDTSEPASVDRKVQDETTIGAVQGPQYPVQSRSWFWSSIPYYVPVEEPPEEENNLPRAPHFTPAWVYPLPGRSWYGLNPNLFPPPAPVVPPDETKIFRGPHFTPPRAPLPAGPSWTQWTPLSAMAAPSRPIGANIYDLPPFDRQPLARTWISNNNIALTASPPPADVILFGQALL